MVVVVQGSSSGEGIIIREEGGGKMRAFRSCLEGGGEAGWGGEKASGKEE